MRCREVWVHAIGLDNDAQFGDFPDIMLQTPLTDIVGMWRRRNRGDGIVFGVTGMAPIAVGDGDGRHVVSGPLASVVRWAAGRGAVGPSGEVPDPSPWL